MSEAYFFVDSISEGMAVLLAGRDGLDRVELPVSALPGGVREGDYLRASFEIDIEKRMSMKCDIDSLLEELGDNP